MDTYSTTSTAAIERTCPICKNLLLENSKGNYYCLQCGYMECLSVNPHPQEDIKRMFEDLDKIDEYKKQNQSKENQDFPQLYGWVCPKCGAVMSPYTSFCPNCTKRNYEITYETNSTTGMLAKIKNGEKITSDEVRSNKEGLEQYIGYSRKDKLGYE